MGVLQRHASPAAAVTHGRLPASRLNEDSPHRFRGGGEEVPAAVEVLVADQPQVRLVDQGGGVEGVAGGLGRYARGGERPQFVVDERQEVGSGLWVAGRGSIEEAGHIGHDVRFYPQLAAEPCENEDDRALLPLGGY